MLAIKPIYMSDFRGVLWTAIAPAHRRPVKVQMQGEMEREVQFPKTGCSAFFSASHRQLLPGLAPANVSYEERR